MSLLFEEIKLKTESDCYGLGNLLDTALKKVIDSDYGIYTIQEENKHVWIIVTNMREFHERYNKGVKFVGGWRSRKIEIFDLKARKAEMDAVYISLDL